MPAANLLAPTGSPVQYIDILENIDKDNLGNIVIDIDIDKKILENIDINIDIYKDILGKQIIFSADLKLFSCFFGEISISTVDISAFFEMSIK